MGKLARLWNPRSSHKLHRYWVSFEDRIVIGGESLDQAGVLSLRPACQGALRARLRVMGSEFEQPVNAGNDIAVWINGLKLFVCVKAVDDARMLLAFGIPTGSKVNVRLEPGAGIDDSANAVPDAPRGDNENDSGYPVGLCQTQT